DGSCGLRNSTNVRFHDNHRTASRGHARAIPGPMALTYALNAPGTPPRTRDAARPRKGDATRAAIVEAALALARRDGLEGLTIGVLAERMRMSKSGVFAHFGSREELQLAVIREYAARFVDEVLRPAVQRPRGLPRLRAL